MLRGAPEPGNDLRLRVSSGRLAPEEGRRGKDATRAPTANVYEPALAHLARARQWANLSQESSPAPPLRSGDMLSGTLRRPSTPTLGTLRPSHSP